MTATLEETDTHTLIDVSKMYEILSTTENMQSLHFQMDGVSGIATFALPPAGTSV